MRLIEALSPAQVLAFSLVTLLMLAVLTWRLLLVTFRRDPPGLFRRSFFDATGQPNGVLLTVFNAVVAINALTINGMFTERWPPVYVWATWGTIVLIGIGADTKVTLNQIEAGKPTPGPELPGPDYSPAPDSSSTLPIPPASSIPPDATCSASTDNTVAQQP